MSRIVDIYCSVNNNKLRSSFLCGLHLIIARLQSSHGDTGGIRIEYEDEALVKRQRLVPRAGVEPARLAARDFKSRASTNFATRAAHNYHPL
jgi:hypothetical protein